MRTRRTITNWVIALLAIALGFVAQGYFARSEITDGLIVYAIAAALLLWAFRRCEEMLRQAQHDEASQLPVTLSDSEKSPPDSNEMFRQPQHANSLYRWLSIVFFVLAAVAIALALREFSRETHLPRGWTFYLASMGSFVASVYLSELGEGHRPDLRGAQFITWREGLILIAILAIGAWMRFYRFNDWPFGTWYDEADNALHVLAMMRDPTYRPIFVPSTNLPAHFLYLIQFAFNLFGPSTQAIRVVTASMGLASIVAAYLFGREFLGRHMALVLAFLLAVSRWDVNFSRIGLHGVSTPLFELLVLCFLLRGLRTRSRIDFVWAGLLTGLGLCFYAPFRLFPIVVILFLLHQQLVEGKSFWRKHSVNLVILATAGLIAFSPVVQYAKNHSAVFWARTNKVSIFKTAPEGAVWPTVWRNTKDHLLMFNDRGDPNGRHNLPGEPMLDYATGALTVLGLVYALSRARFPTYSLLVFWFAVMLCGGIFSLSFEAPQSLRAIGSLPVAYVLACLPIGLVRLESLRTFPNRGGQIFAVLVIALLASIGRDNYHTYFAIQARNFSSWIAYSTVETVMSNEINRLDPGYEMYFAEVLTNHLTTRFLAPRAKNQTPFEPVKHLPFRESGQVGVAVFLDKDNFDLIDLITRYYPDAQIRRLSPPFSGPEFLALALIEREQIEAIQGLPARYYQGAADSASTTYRQDGPLEMVWPEDAPRDFPFEAEWRGILVAPAYGHYGIRLSGVSQDDVELHLDGALLLGDTTPLQREIMLARGRHDLRIRARVEKSGALLLQWRTPDQVGDPTGEWLTIPRQQLYGPPVTANGLVGSFYPNDAWQSPPERVRIDPEISFYFHLIPLKRPYSVEWRGYLDIPETGWHIFGLEVRDAAYLYVDEELVLVNEKPDSYLEQGVDLTAGRHEIRLRYLDRTDHSHVYLYWIPPGKPRDIIPFQHLTPSSGGGWRPVPKTPS